MSIFTCVDCDLPYCINCEDGAQDSCPDCSTGPRCNDCAVDHKRDEHGREASGALDEDAG